MQIDTPIWQLKQICPCCGQGYPSFIICPNCSHLTVRCQETGDTFVDVKNLDLGFADICPYCRQTKTEDFINASSSDILNAGLTKDDYK